MWSMYRTRQRNMRTREVPQRSGHRRAGVLSISRPFHRTRPRGRDVYRLSAPSGKEYIRKRPSSSQVAIVGAAYTQRDLGCGNKQQRNVFVQSEVVLRSRRARTSVNTHNTRRTTCRAFSSQDYTDLFKDVCGEEQSARTEVSTGVFGRGLFLKESLRPDDEKDEVLIHVPLRYLLYIGVTAPFVYNSAAAQCDRVMIDFMESPSVPWSVKLATLLLWATSATFEAGEEPEVSAVRGTWRRYRQFLPELEEMTSILCFKPGTAETSSLQDEVLEYEIGTFEATLSEWYSR